MTDDHHNAFAILVKAKALKTSVTIVLVLSKLSVPSFAESTSSSLNVERLLLAMIPIIIWRA